MIKLVVPSHEYRDEILSFKEEFIINDENIPGGELLDKIDNFDEWLNYITKNSSSDTVSDDWVVTDTFLALNDKIVVGIICLRHELNDFLKDFGHVGYSVRPSCRKKGVATFIFEKILKTAKDLGLNLINVSAEKENVASIRVIEKNNGKLIRKYDYLSKEVYFYRIEI